MRLRATWLAAFLVLGAGVPESAQAQDGSRTETRVTDAAGDVRLQQAGQNLTTLPGTHPQVDLRAAWIANESPEAFEIGYTLQQWDDPFGGADPTARYVTVGFHFGGRSYIAAHGPLLGDSNCPPDKASFGEGDPDAVFPPRGACLNVTVDPSAASATIEVPKTLVKSDRFLSPQVGDPLTHLVAVSQQLTGFGFAEDRAPDEGHGGPFVLRRGTGEQTGALLLQVAQPVRASNGESTTIVFRVRLANQADAEMVAALTAEEDNPEWTVRLPARLRLPAQSHVDFPVILSMNFTHQHGVTEYLRVRADSVSPPGHSSSVSLGVHWLEIPQPAGHHDRLWLHSAVSPDSPVGSIRPPPAVSGQRSLWMNPAEVDPRPGATDDEVGGATLFPVEANTAVAWWAPLNPALQIGLDMDETRAGWFETTIRSSLSSPRATLTAFLFYCDQEGETPGAADRGCGDGTRVDLFSGAAAPTTLPAGAEAAFGFELVPNATLGILPYQLGRNVGLRIVLESETPQGVALVYRAPTAVLLPRASAIQIPLVEYHDPVDQSFQAVGSLQLHALDPFEKPVNPGRRTLFRFDLTNVGPDPQDVRLGLEGINADWATVHEGSMMTVESQGRKQVTVVVQPPPDAAEGERAELFFVAESTRDPTVVTLARLRATVVSPDVLVVPDETPSALATEAPTPGILPLAVLGLLAVQAVWLRLRRGGA